MINAPATTRSLDWFDVSMATRRMAATGGTLAARRAGKRAATSVTSTPTVIELRMVVVEITGAVAGTPIPAASSRALSPTARPMPAANPSKDATIPTARASRKIDPSTCPRPAPMARSRATSRVRWATMIENVL